MRQDRCKGKNSIAVEGATDHLAIFRGGGSSHQVWCPSKIELSTFRCSLKIDLWTSEMSIKNKVVDILGGPSKIESWTSRCPSKIKLWTSKLSIKNRAMDIKVSIKYRVVDS